MPESALLAGRAADLPWWLQELALPIAFGGELLEPLATDGALTWTTPFVAGDPASADFTARFEKRFSRQPDVAAALAYDAALLWIKSVRQAPSPQGGKVKDELVQWKGFPSVAGRLAVDEQHAAHRPLFVLRRDKGETKLLGTWTPDSPK
jgi:ABC-type branched-subunit amino acid transport system substrate-binding protein